MGAIDTFGELPDGPAVQRIRIAGGGLTASVLTFGASIQDLRLSGHASPLVLGFERLDHYLDHAIFHGAIVGRYASRLAHGRFAVGGERFQADVNEASGHSLHGGADGIYRRNWRLSDHGPGHVTLSLRDRDGQMGFPGNVDIACTYRLRPPGVLAVELTAKTDAPTLCNLAQHSWFNLDDGGATSVLDHRMIVHASAYLPVDAGLIPTGAVLPVDNTPFDFRQARTPRWPGPGEGGYDHNFCLAAARRPLTQAAWVQGARSGVEMEVWTTEPGLQFFDGNVPAIPVPGLGGLRYGRHAGICLEPQVWPDSPNRPYFPQAMLAPGEQYRQLTEYRFSAA